MSARIVLSIVLLAAPSVGRPAQRRRSSCTPYDSRPTVFVHASLLTMRDTTLHPGMTVVVDKGRIAWIGTDADAQRHTPANVRRIDAAGRTLMPGLADMHVHLDPGDTTLYPRYGVTHVREMNGSPTLLALRDAICAGRALGPSMSVTGPLLAGTPQPYRHVLVQTADSATRVVTSEAAAGFEAVKVYDGLSLDAYNAIVAAAAAHDLPVYGHIPRDVGFDGVLAAKQRSLEHLDQLISAIGSHDAPADSATMADAASRIRSVGSWVTPTMAVEYALSRTGSESYANDLLRPEMALVDTATLDWWKSLSRSRGGGSLAAGEFPTERSREYFARKQLLLRTLERAGVPLLAGTDTPNPLMVPGYSLVEELIALHRAGLSNARVLRMATRDAAAFLGQTSEFGTIEVGARADLLLVRGNPLEDLASLRSLDGVMLRGRWMPSGDPR